MKKIHVSSRRLPPLKSLLAFEAAGRLESFLAAAEELNVTPSAISHQIRLLEDFAGTALFRRGVRQVALTAAGRAALPAVRRGFDEFQAALAAVGRHRSAQPLIVSVVPSLAVKWLIPRLDRFPGAARVHLVATRERADLLAGEADIAIRFGMGDYPGLDVVRLFDETVTPICAPKWLKGRRALKTPKDLARVPLLHDDAVNFDPLAPDWKSWLAAAGHPGISADRGQRFASSEHVLEAAIAGAGVALGRRSLAADDIAAGRLVAPFDLTLLLQPAFYLLTAPDRTAAPEIAPFRAWLLKEAARFKRRVRAG